MGWFFKLQNTFINKIFSDVTVYTREVYRTVFFIIRKPEEQQIKVNKSAHIETDSW